MEAPIVVASATRVAEHAIRPAYTSPRRTSRPPDSTLAARNPLPNGADRLVHASAVTVRGAGTSHDRWRDNAGWRATATSGAPLRGTAHCNNENLGAEGEKAARIPSADKGAAGIHRPRLALRRRLDNLKVGPREVSLPKVKPRNDAPTSSRGVFIPSSFLVLVQLSYSSLSPSLAESQRLSSRRSLALATPDPTAPAAISEWWTGLVGPAKVALSLAATNRHPLAQWPLPGRTPGPSHCFPWSILRAARNDTFRYSLAPPSVSAGLVPVGRTIGLLVDCQSLAGVPT